jgi:hypothetical protein
MLSIFALVIGEKSGNVVIMGLMVVAIVEVALVRYLLIVIVMKISYSKPFFIIRPILITFLFVLHIFLYPLVLLRTPFFKSLSHSLVAQNIWKALFLKKVTIISKI